MKTIEIEFLVSELKRAFTGLNKVIGKSPLPALQCARLERDAEGTLSLTVTDLDSAATCRAFAMSAANEPVTMLIPWELIRKAVSGKSERASFIREKADMVAARTYVGAMPFDELAGMPPLDEWPNLPPIAGEWFDPGPAFKSALHEALSYASSDPTRLVLNGACLDLGGSEGHYVVATDASQVYAANTFQFPLPRSIIVPSRKFLLWGGFVDDGAWRVRTLLAEEIGGANWVEIGSDHWTFRTRLIDGQYPNWRQVFPIGTEGMTVVHLTPEAVKALCDLAPAVRTGENRNEAICLSTRGGKLFLNNRPAVGADWSEIEIPGAVAVGPRKALLAHRDRFIKALRMGISELELREPLTPMVLRTNGKQMALALYRGDTPQPSAGTSGPSAPPPPTSTAAERNNVNTLNDRKHPAQPQTEETELEQNPIRAAIAQVDQVRNQFRECLNGLNQAMTQLKAAEREQKATAREIDSVRGTLRSLQRVQI